MFACEYQLRSVKFIITIVRSAQLSPCIVKPSFSRDFLFHFAPFANPLEKEKRRENIAGKVRENVFECSVCETAVTDS